MQTSTIHPIHHDISSSIVYTTGENTQDLMGMQLLNLVHPDDAGRVTEALRRAMITQGAQVYNN